MGNGEVSLLEIARAYSAIANKGRLRDLRCFIDELIREKGVIFSQRVSYLITNILSDNNAREPAFGEFSPLNLPFECAAKTGTSKDFRDNWTVGYTPRYTVAVWVGNFNGEPMYSVSGISGAGPIFRDIMLTLEVRNNNLNFTVPRGIKKVMVCSKSGKLPQRCCTELLEETFINGTEPKRCCKIHRLYEIDKRNNLIAAKDCPEQFIEKKVYEIYPVEYYDWAKYSGIELPPTQISNISISGRSVSESRLFDIESPKNGDVFKIDPILRRDYQRITLKPKTDIKMTSVKWFVDNNPIITEGYPFVVNWKIEMGKHIINYIAMTTNGKTIKSRDIGVTVVD